MRIRGTNNPGYAIEVDSEGRLETHSVTLSESSRASEKGELFNLTTGVYEFTSDTTTPLLYFKNTGEDRPLKIISITVTLAESTGGAGGPAILGLYPNPTGGTIIDSPINAPLANFNIGSGNTLSVESRFGGGSTTVVSDTTVPILIPSDKIRVSIDLDAVIIPRGRSVAIGLTPPAGNTSMLGSISLNIYQEVEQ